MTPEVIMYHAALAELSRAARAFSSAMVHAADSATHMSGSVDDLIAQRTFNEVRETLIAGFSSAPGMISLFTGKAA